ncbi:hypothetical protein FFF34_018285 [Inquilinus sp. KBS0705]|nr:hypothetical protein FFF34_018285 [Inquilinus sp. KBS0705]
MKIPVTPALLKLVISQGFKYCYSKTTCVDTAETDVCIILTPVKQAPKVRRLPKAYDTFFNILKEPMQMAAGVDRTLIFFEIDKNLLTTI